MEGVNQFELAPSNIQILDSGISVPSRSVATVIIDHFLCRLGLKQFQQAPHLFTDRIVLLPGEDNPGV